MPKCRAKHKTGWLCLVLLLFWGLMLGACTLERSEQEEPTKEVKRAEPETIAQAPTTEVPDAALPPQPFHTEDQPAVLTMLLAENGTTYEDLAQRGCSQLVCVVANGTSATIRFFSCNDSIWQEHTQLSCKGYVGRSGVRTDKREGDGSTPGGLYGIGNAFYMHDTPETALDTFQITTDTYWVDDPNSKFYNQRVEGLENKDWDSAEHMIDYPVYRYGFVVEYNLTAEYNAGSAIFFHIGDNPTAGCIATEIETVKAYLAELDTARKPCILILRESGV